MRIAAMAVGLALLAAGCASKPDEEERTSAATPALGEAVAVAPSAGPPLSVAALAQHVQTLASDEYEGRAPGTPGEVRTLNYIISQFEKIGLSPGPEGEWLQPVELLEARVQGEPSLTIRAGAEDKSYAYGVDHVIWTKRNQAAIALVNAQLVFVGYGIVAPELGWNDYAGQDMRGKIAVILVNDPDFEADLGGKFGGKAMTYYGRWTYKFEEAARQGAAGALIIHETAPAAYPWAVVYSSWTGPQFDVVRADNGMSRVGVEGWMSTRMAADIFQRAGVDFAQLKASAQRPGFAPLPLTLSGSVNLLTDIKKTVSHNVIGVLPGRSARDDVVLYTAHWDHLGRCPAVNGDDICNGARDNATGVAGLIELARRFKQEGANQRTIAFVGFTAEEKGLLGSAYYAANPLYPANRTVAAINMDGLPVFGASKDMVIVGYGKSELDAILDRHVRAQGRVTAPESFPERGGYFRSDHFELAKIGIPALYASGGIDLITGGSERGAALSNAYVANQYHKPDDEFDPTWDFTGASLDLQALYAVGKDIANTPTWPAWKAGAEFKAARDESLAKK